MIKSILRFLGGDGGEDKQMLLLLGKGFFMGIMLATYKVCAETLFISVIGERLLSEAFFITGALGILFTMIFVFLQKKINFSSLVTSMIFIIFLLIVGSRVTFHMNDYQINDTYEKLVFALFIMVGPIFSVTLLGFWGIFGRIFDLKQQKRIIGGIDTGQLFATLIAFFSVPLLTRTIINETHDLLLVSSVAAVGVFGFTILLSINFNLDRVTKVPKDTKIAKVTYLDLFKNKYLRLLSIFLIFSMGASVFANYTFITSIETWFKLDDDTMTAVEMENQKLLLSDFLSFFNGAIIILSFIIQSFINDFIIGKFGLKIALMTMPFILAIFTIGAIISGYIFTYDIRTDEYILFFLFTASAKLLTDSLKDALENPAFKLFFLPIEIQNRFDIQTRIEGVVNELAKLSAGAMQLGLGLLAFFELIHYSYFILAMAGMVVWLSSKLFTQYKVTLKKTLQNQRDKLKNTGKKNEYNTITVLKNDVKSRDVDLSFQSLKVLEKLEPIEFEYTLLDMINSRNAGIREHAYIKLGEYLCFDSLEIIEKEATTEGDDGALRAATATLKVLREAAAFTLTDDVAIRKLVRSTKATDRTKGARLLIKASEDRHIVFLVELLRDINPQVRTAAIITAGKVKRPELWTMLVENLHLATYSNVAMSALTAAGDATFYTIDSSFYKTGQYLSSMLRIVQLMGRIGGRQASELLWKKIDFPDRKIVSELLLSLSYQGFRGKEFQSARINLMVETEIGDVAWNLKVLEEIPKHIQLDRMIRTGFLEENKANISNIFMLLGMIYDPQNILLVRESIMLGTTESISFAVEMLDVFVGEGLKPKLLPVLDEIKVEDKLAKLRDHYAPEYFESYEDLLLQIVNRDYNRVNRYTKALAMHRLSLLSKTVTMDMIAILFSPDPLLLQTAAHTIYSIDKEAYQKHTKRLKPMTKKGLDKSILPPVFKNENEVYHKKMLLIERVILLKEMEIFSKISGQQITHLAESMDEILVDAGTQLIEEGEGGNMPIYILLDGNLEMWQAEEKINEIGRLGIVGEKVLLETDKFNYSVVAVESSKLLVLRKEELLDLMSLHLDIVEAMLDVLKEGTESVEDEKTMEVFV